MSDLKIKNIRDELPKHPEKEYPKRDIEDITHIDIHHSASKKDEGKETIEGFARYHINGHNWPGLGYHYVVDKEGTVYKTGVASEMRWSVGGNNSYTISIMIMGDFTQQEPTEEQWNAVVELVKTVMNAYNVPVENVMGHNEFPHHSTNSCPGIDMNELRNALV